MARTSKTRLFGESAVGLLALLGKIAGSALSELHDNSSVNLRHPDLLFGMGDVGPLPAAALAAGLREPRLPRMLSMEAEVDCTAAGGQARRLELSVGQGQIISKGHVGNVVATALDDTEVVVAFQDFARGRRGFVAACQASGSELGCSPAAAFTGAAATSATAGALAMAAVEGDRLVLAWAQGGTPYVGHIQLCMSDVSQCGADLVVRVEWAAVAVAVFSSSSLVFAYIDKQKGHRGTIHLCDVAGLVLMCDGGHVFERSPMDSLSLVALSDSAVIYQGLSGDLVLAYEVRDPRDGQFGRLQPCTVSGDALACDPSAAVRFTEGPSDGCSLAALSSRLFIVGYADRQTVCPRPTSQRRRRELHVCSLADGHPSIGRVRLCRASPAGPGALGLSLACGESTVVDDGYATQCPELARQNASAFVAAYGCDGCGDTGSRGLLRYCQVNESALDGDLGSFIGNITCGPVVAFNNASTRWVRLAAVGGGFAAAYDDYGGQGKGTTRFVG